MVLEVLQGGHGLGNFFFAYVWLELSVHGLGEVLHEAWGGPMVVAPVCGYGAQDGAPCLFSVGVACGLVECEAGCHGVGRWGAHWCVVRHVGRSVWVVVVLGAVVPCGSDCYEEVHLVMVDLWIELVLGGRGAQGDVVGVVVFLGAVVSGLASIADGMDLECDDLIWLSCLEVLDACIDDVPHCLCCSLAVVGCHGGVGNVDGS